MMMIEALLAAALGSLQAEGGAGGSASKTSAQTPLHNCEDDHMHNYQEQDEDGDEQFIEEEEKEEEEEEEEIIYVKESKGMEEEGLNLHAARDALINFLETCPIYPPWKEEESSRQLELFGETIRCVRWEGRFFMTGTDVMRCISWRFRLGSLPLPDQKKFEEGVFSDLRNLKPGLHALLENPHSPFLEFLFRLGCIRTHKKQKVFFWDSIPHERLFQEALRRVHKRDAEEELHSAASPKRFKTSSPSFSEPKEQLLPSLTSILPEMFSNDSPSPSVSSSSLPSSSSSSSSSSSNIALPPLSSFSSLKSKVAPRDPVLGVFLCDFAGCGRGFQRLQHLKRHWLIHTGDRPFQCPIDGCARWFSRADNLAQHLKIHEKPSSA